MRCGRAWATLVAFVVGVALTLPLGLYLGAQGDLIDVTVSPGGRERLEFYRPTRWQRLVLGYRDHDYAYVRLSDAASGDVLSVSPVFYNNGAGPTVWGKTDVAIGMAVTYDRAARRWRVEQE